MSEPIWRGRALAAIMDGEAPRPIGDITSVSIDTRTLEPGALFFAIQGEARDGHDFVEAALTKGAAAAIVDHAHAHAFAPDARVIVVEDVLGALVKLGIASRARLAGPAIAVTGSVGKTSTKEMLRLAFASREAVHASVASYNNHWGVPLTLARMPAETRLGIFEIGMNHAFEILPLAAMVRPHVAIVTTIEPVHLAHFRGIEGIADAKGEIFSGLEPGGVAIINGDNPHATRLVAHAGASRAGRILRFGAGEKADIRLVECGLEPDASDVTANVFGRSIRYRIGAPGRHFAMNSLAVLAAAHAIGADVAAVAAALSKFGSVEGRGRRMVLPIAGGNFTLIDESYNANPSSVRAALAVAGKVKPGAGGRRIAVLGDMLELGPEGVALHRGLAGALVDNGIDVAFLAGPLMKNLHEDLPKAHQGAYAETSERLEPLVLDALRAGDVVMIKGSLGSKMGRIVTALKAKFGERA